MPASSGGDGGRYGSGFTRQTSPPGSSSDSLVFIAEVRNELKTQGREIGEIKKDMKEVSKSVTQMAALMPHLVTKESCAISRSKENQALKDRMDGKREVTGVGMTLPELWDKARIAQEATSDPLKTERNPAIKPQRDFVYWFKFVASIIGVLTFLFGSTAFVVKTMQRQDRTEEVLQSLEKQLGTKSAPAPAGSKAPPGG